MAHHIMFKPIITIHFEITFDYEAGRDAVIHHQNMTFLTDKYIQYMSILKWRSIGAGHFGFLILLAF